MKILKITDTHLSKYNNKLVEDVFNQMIIVSIEESVDLVVFLGDWFTSREGQSLSVLKSTEKILKNLQDNLVCNIVMITGNHDKSNQESDDSFLDSFFLDSSFKLGEKSKIRLIKTPTTINMNDVDLDFLPYYPEKSGMIANKMKDYGLSGDYLFTHCAIDGVRNNDGSIVEGSLKKELFDSYKKVFVGHYHDKQSFDNVFYIGSAYQGNYGEDMDKGVTILDTDEGSLIQVKLDTPMYQNIEVNALDFQSKIDEIKDMKSKGVNVKVKLKGEREEVESINLSELKKIGVSVSKTSSSQELDLVVNNKETIVKSFDRFCNEKGIVGDSYEYGLTKIKSKW